MVEEYHQTAHSYYNENQNKIYYYYDIDRNPEENEKIHYIERSNSGLINLNIKDINIGKYKMRLNLQDSSSLKKKDTLYKYICIFLFIISLAYFAKEILILFKHQNEYLNSLMENKPFSKEILNWYKVKMDSKTIEPISKKLMHILIILSASIGISIIVNAIFQIINKITYKIQMYIAFLIHTAIFLIILAGLGFFFYKSIYHHIFIKKYYSNWTFKNENKKIIKVINIIFFWIKVIFLWIIHLKIAFDLVLICVFPIIFSYKSLRSFKNKSLKNYLKYSKKSFLVRSVGHIVAQIGGTLLLGIPVFLFYSYFITYQEKQKYFEARNNPYIWDIIYITNKKYYIYALSNIFCKIMPFIIYTIFNVIKNYVKCAVTGAYAEQYLEEVRDIDSTIKNMESTYMKKYLKVSLSCLGSICHDSLNYIIMFFKNVLLTLKLIKKSKIISDFMDYDNNLAKIGHTEYHYIQVTRTYRNGILQSTSRQNMVDTENIMDYDYLERLNNESYQNYVDIIGEYTNFKTSFFSNYVDILFSNKTFNEAFSSSFVETNDIFIPYIIILMRIFSALICSFIVTGISSYFISYKILHEAYFSIFSLIIFTIEFFKAYISNQIFAYGPQIASICVYKNNKLKLDTRHNIYVLAKYIKND